MKKIKGPLAKKKQRWGLTAAPSYPSTPALFPCSLPHPSPTPSPPSTLPPPLQSLLMRQLTCFVSSAPAASWGLQRSSQTWPAGDSSPPGRPQWTRWPRGPSAAGWSRHDAAGGCRPGTAGCGPARRPAADCWRCAASAPHLGSPSRALCPPAACGLAAADPVDTTAREAVTLVCDHC